MNRILVGLVLIALLVGGVYYVGWGSSVVISENPDYYASIGVTIHCYTLMVDEFCGPFDPYPNGTYWTEGDLASVEATGTHIACPTKCYVGASQPGEFVTLTNGSIIQHDFEVINYTQGCFDIKIGYTGTIWDWAVTNLGFSTHPVYKHIYSHVLNC